MKRAIAATFILTGMPLTTSLTASSPASAAPPALSVDTAQERALTSLLGGC